MMLIIADEDPVSAVQYLVNNMPTKFWTKQMLELSQLICSVGYSDVYRKVSRGKRIQNWITRNIAWVYKYYGELFKACAIHSGYKYSPETIAKFYTIFNALRNQCLDTYLNQWKPKTAVFRYVKDYTDTKYSTDSELELGECIKEYRKYLKWKARILKLRQSEKKVTQKLEQPQEKLKAERSKLIALLFGNS